MFIRGAFNTQITLLFLIIFFRGSAYGMRTLKRNEKNRISPVNQIVVSHMEQSAETKRNSVSSSQLSKETLLCRDDKFLSSN